MLNRQGTDEEPAMDILCTSASPVGRVLVIHSWWGLTRSFRDYAANLCAAGYAVGLSDLFGGQTASDMEQAKHLRRKPRKIPMYKSLLANIDELLAFGSRPASEVSLVGFSMGGHWAVWLSQQRDVPVRSVVLYYAARAGSFADSRASYLAHFAQHDPWVSGSARRNMERAISKAGRNYTAYDYPGTGHWFAETGRPEAYNAEAATSALERTLVHLGSV